MIYGNLESHTSPGGAPDHRTTYVHDALGRMSSKLPGPSAQAARIRELAIGATSFSYDQGANGLGRLTGATLPFGTVALEYDAWGNLTDETRTVDLGSALGVALADTLTVHADTHISDGKPMFVQKASGIRTFYTHFGPSTRRWSARHVRGRAGRAPVRSIIQMSPHGPAQDAAVSELDERLKAALGQRAIVRVQSAFAASDGSEPEPDIAVVPRRDYRREHPW